MGSSQDEIERLSAALRKRAEEHARGKYVFEVRLQVSGAVTYRVRADVPEEAKEKAERLFYEHESPRDDYTECSDPRVRLLEPETLIDLLRLPRDE